AARTHGDHATTFEVTEDWLQGRPSFGGLISAYAVQAMRDVASAGWPANVSLRALQTSFIAPIGSGKVDVAVRLLREGKSVRQVQAEVRKDGQTCSVMLGVFAVQRASALAVLRPTRPAPARQSTNWPRCHSCREPYRTSCSISRHAGPTDRFRSRAAPDRRSASTCGRGCTMRTLSRTKCCLCCWQTSRRRL